MIDKAVAREVVAADRASLPEASGAPVGRTAHPGVLHALFVLNSLSVGGSERKIVRLANRLRQRGTNVGIVYLNGPDTLAPMLREDVPRWHLRREGKFSVAALRRLASIVETRRPQVMFAVNLYPSLYASGVAAMLGRRAPRTIALVNTTHFAGADGLRKAFYRPVLGSFDRVIYGCEVQRDAWLRHTDRAWSRSMVLYNGVDLHEFDAAIAPAVPTRWRSDGAHPFVIGTIGRLAPEKNHRSLIDALDAVRKRGVNAKLLLVGDGALRADLIRHAAQRSLTDHFEMTGNLPEVRPLLAAMDVFVLPSLYVETFSNAALEAMAMRKPVVLSDIGGAREMVRDGVDGYVIARPDLAEKLPTVLEHLATDEASRVCVGQAARQRVEALFAFETMVERYEELIRGAHDGHDG